MRFIERFCRVDYESDQDFREHFSITAPPRFNYGFDVVDELAKIEPDKTALIWCNDKGKERLCTFGDIARLSSKAAGALAKAGVRQGDAGILILKRSYQVRYAMRGLHKLGASSIRASEQRTAKGIA